MKANDRVKSQYNQGTVQSVVPAVVIRWDGFAWPIEVPAEMAATFEVIGSVESDDEKSINETFTPADMSVKMTDEEYEGYCDSEAAKRLGD